MTDNDGIKPPARVEVTARFLADNQQKRLAYAARRKVWTAAFGGASKPRAQTLSIKPARGRIHDPRQGSFEL